MDELKQLAEMQGGVVYIEQVEEWLEKVVEQLEEISYDMEICEEQFDMNSPYFMDVEYKMVKLEEAISIVRKGGDNND